MRNPKKAKVIVAHPLQQHSYRTAESLKNNDVLHSYLTTVYYQSNSFLYNMLGRILGSDNIKRMRGRRNKIINEVVKTNNELLGVVYLFLIRYDKNKTLEPFIYGILTRLFGNFTANYCIKEDADAIVMYDTTAYVCFSKLAKTNPNIIKILDMSSAAAPYIRSIILKELNLNDSYKKSLKVKLKSYNKTKSKYYFNEIKAADYFLVSSNFVEKSLCEYGVDKAKIINVPYGVDISDFTLKDYNKKKPNKKIKFLFVGRVEAAKGIYYLFEAFKQLTHLDIELLVVGSIEMNIKELANCSENIKFLGPVNKKEISKIYQNVDVYVMPSLWEGFSLTIFEAMASGLPVIASKNSGAEGVITDYEQGFIVETCSIEELVNKITWFYQNPSSIEPMGNKARKLAERYSWEVYQKKIASSIEYILDGSLKVEKNS